MGSGIAQVALSAGVTVILHDLADAAREAARDSILARLKRLVEKGVHPAGFVEDADQRLTLAPQLVDVAPADVVIEAVIEQLAVKQTLFADLERIVRDDTILATNTSSLSVAAIARDCRRKDRVCGLHFFNPVPIMKLVEVIVHPGIDPAVQEAAVSLARQLGKVPVTVRDGPGFLVNLGGRAYTTEALHAAEERIADPATIDSILRDGAGFRMGPFELMDLTGIDVNFPATSFIYEGYQHDPRIRTTPLHAAMFNAGRFGRKTGLGFHDYSAAPAAPGPAAVEEPAGQPAAFRFRAPAGGAALASLRGFADAHHDDAETVLVTPLGEDAASITARLGLDPARVVAIDLTGIDRDHVTLTAPLGGAQAIASCAAWLRQQGYRVAVIGDSPGFVLQRVLAMIANLGCEMAQIGIGTPDDIDTAMKLAQNYPLGPFEIVEKLGAATVLEILQNLQAVSGSDRYRPSLWLRRRALLNRSIREAD
ncbi:3-hydroxyacyl-CoA dehydrogenase [Sphingomonas flavalba]|uniref:3-hydroxyacyl-CoA dehydrogenase n=1 Tax=Sphingomonas flavalba TaxID=2559804 RepID=UPI0039E03562